MLLKLLNLKFCCHVLKTPGEIIRVLALEGSQLERRVLPKLGNWTLILNDDIYRHWLPPFLLTIVSIKYYVYFINL